MATLDALLQLQRLMAPGGPGSALPSRPQDTTYYSDINPRPSGGPISQDLIPPEVLEIIRRTAPMQRQLPPGLPDAVRESILQGRSYGEGQVIPGGRGFNYWPGYSDFAPDAAQQQMGGHAREQLNYELGMAKQFPNYGFPLGEGEIAVPTDTKRLRYSRPYNLGLGNLGALF